MMSKLVYWRSILLSFWIMTVWSLVAALKDWHLKTVAVSCIIPKRAAKTYFSSIHISISQIFSENLKPYRAFFSSSSFDEDILGTRKSYRL